MLSLFKFDHHLSIYELFNSFRADVSICRHEQFRFFCRCRHMPTCVNSTYLPGIYPFLQRFCIRWFKMKKTNSYNLLMLKNNYSTIFNSKLKFLADTCYLTQKMKSKSLPFSDVGICRHLANRSHLEKKARQLKGLTQNSIFGKCKKHIKEVLNLCN